MIVPSTVQDVLMARIDSLAESAKDVLQTGSVVGREFNQDLIQAVTGLSERELLSDLSVLKDSEFLYERGIYPQSSYIFIHALTQEVAYNSLLSKRRKGIHAAIGKAIESLHVQRLDEFYEILAYHYSKGDSFEKAYQYLKLSGNKTTRNYSNWEAFRFYKDALEVLNQLSDSQDNKRKQIEVILLMSGPMISLNYPEDSLRILEEGVRLCKKLIDKKSLATIYSLLGIYYMHRGKPLEAIKYSEVGFEEPRKLQDLELMAPIARGLCISYLAAGKVQQASDFAPMVIDLLERAHRESDLFGAPFHTYSLLCAYYALSLAMLGNFIKATAYLKKGLGAASAINHLASLGVVEAMFGLMFIIKGDGTNAIKHFQNSIQYFEESKTVLIFAVSWSGLGSGYYLCGDFESATTHIDRGIELTNRGGSEWWKSFHYLYLSKIHFDLDDHKKSRSAIEEALKIAQNNSEKHFEGASWAFLGRILGKTDPSQSDTAATYLRKGIEILNELKIKPWFAEGHLYLGELCANTGNREDALKHLKKAESVFQEIGMDYYLSKTQEILSRL
jgi:tetratricopeptide (TPR) repeat protein